MGVPIVLGDASSPGDVSRVFDAASADAAVVSTLGGCARPGRRDLALRIDRVLRDPATVGQALAAVDADEARCVRPIVSFPLP